MLSKTIHVVSGEQGRYLEELVLINEPCTSRKTAVWCVGGM